VLARLATVDRGALRDLLEEAWRRNAPKRLVDQYDGSEPIDRASRPGT
jgi:hypothetical protein